MKAISLLQPWATLVVLGVKTVETRSWSTRHRGDILIHASQGKSGQIFGEYPPIKRYIPDFNRLPFGAIIGQANITSVVKINDIGIPDELINRLTLEEKAFGDYTEGRYAWLMKDFVKFEHPIPARGTLSIWEYPGNNNTF